MKRILYLTRGGQFGGSQRQLYHLLSNLNGSFSPVVFLNGDGDFAEKMIEQGITSLQYHLPPWRKFPKGFFRYYYAENLVRKAARHDIALVHCSDLWLSGYMHWIARRLAIPSVLHVRTPICIPDVHKHHCEKATAIVAISRRVRRNLLEAEISPHKIVRIHDSVDLRSFCSIQHRSNPIRQQYRLDDSFVIGLVGRIDKSKKQLEFLQMASALVQKTSQKIVLCFVGPVHQSDYFDKLKTFISEKKMGSYVLLMGQQENMPQVLNAMDVLVTLSGGSVMFEAAACGKPVVAMYPKNEPKGMLKYITSRPILVVQNKTEMVETLLRLIEDHTIRKDVSLRSRLWAERSFDSRQMTAKTQKLYEKLLS